MRRISELQLLMQGRSTQLRSFHSDLEALAQAHIQAHSSIPLIPYHQIPGAGSPTSATAGIISRPKMSSGSMVETLGMLKFTS